MMPSGLNRRDADGSSIGLLDVVRRGFETFKLSHSWAGAHAMYFQVAEKGSECFERLSMKGNSQCVKVPPFVLSPVERLRKSLSIPARNNRNSSLSQCRFLPRFKLPHKYFGASILSSESDRRIRREFCSSLRFELFPDPSKFGNVRTSFLSLRFIISIPSPSRCRVMLIFIRWIERPSLIGEQ